MMWKLMGVVLSMLWKLRHNFEMDDFAVLAMSKD
jgi:hypothetical protein